MDYHKKHAVHRYGFMELLKTLNIASPSERLQSNGIAREFINEVDQVATMIIAQNPAVQS